MRFVFHSRGHRQDVDAHVERARATVDDLARSLATLAPAAGGSAALPLFVDGRPVPGTAPLTEAPIHDGSVVSLGEPAGATDPGATGTGVVEVGVLSGPEAGRAVALAPGIHRLGRAPECAVALASPTVSRAHALIHVLPDGAVRVANLSRTAPALVDGVAVPDAGAVEPAPAAPAPVGVTPAMVAAAQRASAPAVGLDGVELAPTAVLTLGTVHVAVRPLRPADRLSPAEATVGRATMPLNRPPRVLDTLAPAPLEAPVPPASAQKAPFSVSAIAAPAVLGGVMAVAMDSPQFALFALMSPVMVIGNWWETKHRSTKALRRETRQFRAAIEAFEDAVATAQHTEAVRRRAALVDLAEVTRRATEGSIRLWERRAHHDDFLTLTLGCGDVTHDPPVSARHQSQAGPVPEVLDVLARHRALAAVPVPVELARRARGGPAAGTPPPGVVGIAGDRDRALALARALLVQAAVLHGPADVRVAVLTSAAEEWDWVKWLPHVRAEQPGGRERRLCAAGLDDVDALVTDLARERDAAGPAPAPDLRAPGGGHHQEPTTLFVVDGDELVSGSSALRRALAGASGPAAGIVVAPTVARLPAACTALVELGDLGEATVVVPQEGPGTQQVDTAELSRDRAARVARALARWEDPEVSVPGAGLGDLVHLLELLDLRAVTDEEIGQAWNAGGRRHDLRAPIGMTEEGPFVLDLDRHGPHGLIGGTTGSGKSELLKTLVASLAARYPPTELTFGLFDFKGGATFTDFAELPHTVGMADDLDVHLAQRALRCLRAELLHREHTFDAAGVKDLVEFNARFDAGDPRVRVLGPVPRLVVIIDEFAALARTLSGELASLTDLTARGRSLGVHLLLATQKPAASVTSEIRTNTRLRISLLVEDKQDSIDVIGIPDAAAVAVKGRAFVRVGQSDVIPVQTALSTAVSGDDAGPAVSVAPFTFGPAPAGAVTPPPPPPAGPGRAAPPPDLDVLVATMRSVFDRAGVAPPRKPWPDPLPETLSLGELAASGSEAPQPDAIHFALADDPDAQTRYPVGWLPVQGNLLLHGVVGSGTTTALGTIALAAVTDWSVRTGREVHVYVLDFGADELRVLERLPQTGAVVGAAERERQVRLIRWLRREVERRQQLPGDRRQSEPRIVVLVDNFEALRVAFDDAAGSAVYEQLLRVYADGPECGVHMAVTATRVGGVPAVLSSATPARVAFRLADTADYSMLDIRRDQVPTFVPGRAVWRGNAQVVQVALPGRAGLAAAVDELARRGAALQRPPTPIATLPTHVTVAGVAGATEVGPERWVLGVGIGDATLTPVGLTLYEHEHGAVIGPARSGKSTALGTLGGALKGTCPEARVLAIARRRSPLRDHPAVDRVATTDDEIRSVIDAAMVSTQPTLVLVDDAEGVDDPTGALGRLVDAGPASVRIVLAGRPESLRSLYGHWTQSVRRSKAGLLLLPDRDLDGDLLGAQLPRRVHVTMQPGRGFLVADGVVDVVQVAR